MARKINLDDIEERRFEGLPSLLSVGYELRPERMRPNVWRYAPGGSNRWHRQGEQEELYLVLDGSGSVTVGDETMPLRTGDFLVVGPEEWRQLTAGDDGMTVFVVGAPNVADDGIHEDDGENPT